MSFQLRGWGESLRKYLMANLFYKGVDVSTKSKV
jgi:hypothetical protein